MSIKWLFNYIKVIEKIVKYYIGEDVLRYTEEYMSRISYKLPL